MNFKKIELAGFKSFADKIEIKFDSGVTAIVGPNGCGKSNVADAIRWVLGEQSSKNLRGTSMQDVIFNGTERRKSLSFCEVTLTFDNTDRYFNYDFDEVAITRKLYRSGESAYLINRNECRLKDIINLLYDSGIGKDGYSIIGQGKVEQIISSKPEDRRSIFEDAAGISKFKSRKVEAERRLERTRDNIARVNDIVQEIERQMGPMKRQAENAKAYLAFKDQLKDLEINAYVFQYENAKNVKDQINLKIKAISEELTLESKRLEETNANYTQSMERLNIIDKEIENVHNEILRLTVEIEQQSGEIKVIRERLNNLNLQKDKLNLDVLNANNALVKDKTELEFKINKQAELDAKLGQLHLSYDEVSKEYISLVDELTEKEEEASSSQQKMIDAMDKLSDIKVNFSKYQAEKQMLEENLKDLTIRAQEAEKNITEKEAHYKELEKNCKLLFEEKNKTAKIYAESKFKQESLLSEIRETESQKHNLNIKLQVYENKKNMLEGMQNSFDGYQVAVKRLLLDCKKNEGIKNKMMGALATLITVPQKYETAIEVALGNAVQNIVTFNEQGAKDLINYLKTNQYGRATFLPISTIKPRKISNDDKKILSKTGVFGVASELISYSSDIDNIIANLLGTTIIVDNLDTAISVSHNTTISYKIVTLDGDVINPAGSMTGGSRKQEAANLISREREIQTLGVEIQKLQAELLQKNSRLEEMLHEQEFYKNNINKFLDEKNNAEINFVKENEKYQQAKSMLEDMRDELDSISASNAHIKSRISVITDELSSIDELEENAISSKAETSKFMTEKQNLFNELRQKREKLNEQMTLIKIEIASTETEVSAIGEDIIRINYDIDKQNEILINLNHEITSIEETIAEGEKIISSQFEKAENSEKKQLLDQIKQKQIELDSDKQQTQNLIKELDIKKQELNESITKINDKKYAEELHLSKVDTELENMQEKIYEDYSLTYDTCLQFKRPDFDISVAMPEIYRIKREITKLGAVNINAIDDIKILLERYEEKSAQVADLSKAESELTEIIADLSKEMTIRFDTAFQKVSENFKVTFRELFGGGNAKLELIESESGDPLEAGVDIVAEPPGKKLQNITLLSGGEKALTAIAILFSILKLRPMPFCLLDEIEAALDDSNVERFAQYLKRFSKVTQFIVITHRKPTMELADSLYGVTMEEKGVSRTVSVKLADAIKNLEKENKANGAV
ncbi:MAG: chromosome segregation protein SMC [Clostridiales bacterium]|nr:chromosome segregation protein SMC [Clostridiales bacterium]